ncbi:MAG: UbiA family prenyltransferase, partial [Cyclobacteriaceae bacterium]
MISEQTDSLETVTLLDYVKLARIDHWFKNIFMIPGMVIAFLYYEFQFSGELLWNIVAGFLSVCLLASANYVINEWLDAEFDKHHPIKKNRPSVTKNLDGRWVIAMYAILIILGLGLAITVSPNFFLFGFLLLVMGFLYNVKPFRTKERPYIDVLSESINNPIRFILGWFIFVPEAFP